MGSSGSEPKSNDCEELVEPPLFVGVKGTGGRPARIPSVSVRFWQLGISKTTKLGYFQLRKKDTTLNNFLLLFRRCGLSLVFALFAKAISAWCGSGVDSIIGANLLVCWI